MYGNFNWQKQEIKNRTKIVSKNYRKPQKNFWGIGGVVLFFFVPEIIAFFWGADITAYAKNELVREHSFIEMQYYELLVMLFEEGVSYLNLAIGTALFVWLFF